MSLASNPELMKRFAAQRAAQQADPGWRPQQIQHRHALHEMRGKRALDEVSSGRVRKVGKFAGSVRGVAGALQRWRAARPMRKRGKGGALRRHAGLPPNRPPFRMPQHEFRGSRRHVGLPPKLFVNRLRNPGGLLLGNRFLGSTDDQVQRLDY